MSRTFNTAPYAVQASRRGGPIHHRCAIDRPWDPSAGPCDADRYETRRRYRSGCVRWVDVYGGRRALQGAYATGAAHRERTELRAQLVVARRLANGAIRHGSPVAELDMIAELDVAARRRDVSWDLW